MILGFLVSELLGCQAPNLVVNLFLDHEYNSLAVRTRSKPIPCVV